MSYPCPEGHGPEYQMEWGGSRAQFLCVECQRFWGPEGLVPPAGWVPKHLSSSVA